MIDAHTNYSFLMTLEALHFADENTFINTRDEYRSKEFLLNFWRRPNRAATCVKILVISNFASFQDKLNQMCFVFYIIFAWLILEVHSYSADLFYM